MGSVAIPSGGGGRVGDWTSQMYYITSSDYVDGVGYRKNITCEVGDLILFGTGYSMKCHLESYSGLNIINGGVGKEATFAQATSSNVVMAFSKNGSAYNTYGDILIFHLNNHSRYDFNIVRAYGSSGSGSPQNFSDLKLGDIIVSLLGSTGGMGDMNSVNCGLVAYDDSRMKNNAHLYVYLAFKDTASIVFSSDYNSRIFVVCRPK